jgi:protocatechuate 3,4-dioxygenase beta subunit
MASRSHIVAGLIIMLGTVGVLVSSGIANPQDGSSSVEAVSIASSPTGSISSTPVTFEIHVNASAGDPNNIPCKIGYDSQTGFVAVGYATVKNGSVATSSQSISGYFLNGSYTTETGYYPEVRCDTNDNDRLTTPAFPESGGFSVSVVDDLDVSVQGLQQGQVRGAEVRFTVGMNHSTNSTVDCVLNAARDGRVAETTVANDTTAVMTDTVADGSGSFFSEYTVSCDYDNDGVHQYDPGRTQPVEGTYPVYDDATTDTSTDYRNASDEPVSAAFTGNGIKIRRALNSSWYNLTSAGTEEAVLESFPGILDTTGLAQDRYTITEGNTGNTRSIDLLGDANDVIGRISGTGGDSLETGSTQTPSVSLYQWTGNAAIDTSSNTANVSVTHWRNDEYLYMMNISKDKYWIGATNASFGEQVVPARIRTSKPRINDINLYREGNISGVLTEKNAAADKTNKQVKLRRVAPRSVMATRQPYFSAPPIRTDMTGSTGFFNFTGLPAGRYIISVTNTTDAIVGRSDFEGNARVSAGEDKSISLGLTGNVKDISGTLEGVSDPQVKYAVGFFAGGETQGGQILKAGVTPGSFTLKALPDKPGQVIAARFDYRSGSPVQPTVETIPLKPGQTGDIDVGKIGFPQKVSVTGTVTDESGTAIEGARIYFENSTERRGGRAVTNASGMYETRLANSTDYSVYVRPPFDTQYKANSTNISVSGSTTKDLTVSDGSILVGRVTDGSGNGIEGAFAEVRNISLQSTGYTEEGTNATGHFTIEGLSDGTHDIRIYPPGIYGEKRTTVDISGDVTRKTFSVSGDTVQLSGDVTNEDGTGIDATVRVRGDRIAKSTETANDGSYSLSGLPKGKFLEIRIEPADTTTYKPRRESGRLYQDETQDFTLIERTGIQGYVLDSNSDAVAGAWIGARNTSVGSSDYDQVDEDGFYSLDISKANHSIYIWPGEDSSLQPKRLSTFNVSNYTDGQKNFTLSSGQTLAGNITPAQGTTTLSGRIGIWNSSSESYAFTEFANGTYSVSGLADVGHRIVVETDQQSFQRNRTTVGKLSNVGNTKNITMSRPNGRKVEITVEENISDGTNTPIANASVIFGATERSTGTDGIVTYSNQPTGAEIDVAVKADGYEARRTSVTIKSKKTGSGSLSGTKEWQNVSIPLNAVQKPIEASVNVTKGSRSGQAVSSASVIFVSNETGSSQSSSGVTGSSGWTGIPDLIPGPYLITLVIDDDKFGTTSSEVSLSAGTTSFSSVTIDSTTYHIGYEVSEQ